MIFKTKFSFINDLKLYIATPKLCDNFYPLSLENGSYFLLNKSTVIQLKLDENFKLKKPTGYMGEDDNVYCGARLGIIHLENYISDLETIRVKKSDFLPKIIEWMESRRDFFLNKHIEEVKELL